MAQRHGAATVTAAIIATCAPQAIVSLARILENKNLKGIRETDHGSEMRLNEPDTEQAAAADRGVFERTVIQKGCPGGSS